VVRNTTITVSVLWYDCTNAIMYIRKGVDKHGTLTVQVFRLLICIQHTLWF